MATTTENSVLVALSELASMETGRIEAERARAAKAMRELEEKAAHAAAVAREEAARTAEAERLRKQKLEAEATVRVAAELEHERRLAAMRAELDSIKQDRALAHELLTARVAAPAEPRRGGLVVAFGISSSIAAALAALLVVQANASRAPVRAEAPAAPAVVAIESPAEDVVPEIEAAALDAEETPAAVAPVAAARERGRVTPHVRPVRDTHDEHEHDAHDLGHALDFGDGDGMLPSGHHL